MLFSKRFHLFVLGLTLAAAGSAQELEDAERLLYRTAERYRQAQSYHFVATERTVTAAGDQRRETVTLVVTARDEDGRTRVEFDSGAAGGIAVSDGEAHWIYMPQRGQYAKLPASSAGDPSVGAPDFSPFARRFLERYSSADQRIIQARITGSEAVALASGEVDCHVVEVSYDPPPGLRDGKIDRTYWIAEDRNLIVRERSVASMLQPNSTTRVQVTQELDFQAALVDAPLDEDLFTFVPPAGAVQVESFRETAAEDAGAVAPDFTLTTYEGETVQLSDLKGQVVLLDFWATWCGPCRYDMPHVQALHEELKDADLTVYGVNSEPASKARPYLEQHGITFPTLVDLDMQAAKLYRVNAIPTFVVIDREGRISSYMRGTRTREQLRAALVKAGL